MDLSTHRLLTLLSLSKWLLKTPMDFQLTWLLTRGSLLQSNATTRAKHVPLLKSPILVEHAWVNRISLCTTVTHAWVNVLKAFTQWTTFALNVVKLALIAGVRTTFVLSATPGFICRWILVWQFVQMAISLTKVQDLVKNVLYLVRHA